MGSYDRENKMKESYKTKRARASVGGQPRGYTECPFRGVTSSGRVWWTIPEGDAPSQSVPSVASGSLEDDTGKRCSECSFSVVTNSGSLEEGQCRKARLGVCLCCYDSRCRRNWLTPQ